MGYGVVSPIPAREHIRGTDSAVNPKPVRITNFDAPLRKWVSGEYTTASGYPEAGRRNPVFPCRNWQRDWPRVQNRYPFVLTSCSTANSIPSRGSENAGRGEVSDGAIARRYPADGMHQQMQAYGVTEIDEETPRPAAQPPAPLRVLTNIGASRSRASNSCDHRAHRQQPLLQTPRLRSKIHPGAGSPTSRAYRSAITLTLNTARVARPCW